MLPSFLAAGLFENKKITFSPLVQRILISDQNTPYLNDHQDVANLNPVLPSVSMTRSAERPCSSSSNYYSLPLIFDSID